MFLNRKTCSHCANCIKCDLWYDPTYWLVASIAVGILFAGVSWSIIYYIIFLIIWEIGYWIYTGYDNNSEWDFELRLGLVLGTLFGFLIGRTLHDKADCSADWCEFRKDMRYYFHECGWIDAPEHMDD